jgi:uncharacterized protein (DUF1778 family)
VVTNRQHSEVLPSRYTPDQARRVKAASVLAGGSVSAFIRNATVAAAQERLAEASVLRVRVGEQT